MRIYRAIHVAILNNVCICVENDNINENALLLKKKKKWKTREKKERGEGRIEGFVAFSYFLKIHDWG